MSARPSLRVRLVLAGALAIVLALGASAFGLAALFGAQIDRRALAEMSAQIDLVLAGIDLVDGQIAMATPPSDPRFSQPYSGYYWQVILPSRTLRARALWDQVLILPDLPATYGQISPQRIAGPQGQQLLATVLRVTLPARLGAPEAVAVVAFDSADLRAARRAFVADLAPYMLLLAGVLIAAGWAQITVGLRPLDGLRSRVAGLSIDPALRMGPDWPAEVRGLAAELDHLLDARAADLDRARLRAGDLAHGLKTPLQALMGEAARLRAAGAQAEARGIEDIVIAMRRTVDRELARARRMGDPMPARSDLRQTLEGLMAVLQKTPDGQRVAWTADLPAGLWVALDQGDLSEALGAILENAARHAKTRVQVRGGRFGPDIVVQVTDDGRGIPAAQRAAMLHRFSRLDESGSGMGLAIAHEIIRLAGGEITLSGNGDDLGQGAGLSVRLRIPAQDKPS